MNFHRGNVTPGAEEKSGGESDASLDDAICRLATEEELKDKE